MFYLYVPLRTLIPSYFTRVPSYSIVSYSCSLYFTRVLLLFTFPFVFYSYSLVFPLLNSCFTHVLLVFTLIRSCSTRVHPYSLVFIGVLLVFPFVWCFRLDRFIYAFQIPIYYLKSIIFHCPSAICPLICVE